MLLQVARWCFENGMGTIMLQAGELPNPSRLAYLQELVSKIIKETVAMDLERRGLDPQVCADAVSSAYTSREPDHSL